MQPDPVQTTTTEETALRTKGQRHINLLWEICQAIVVLSVDGTELYSQLNGLKTPILDGAFLLVTGMYLQRTNHTNTGGVGKDHQGR